MSSSATPCFRADGWISTKESYYKTAANRVRGSSSGSASTTEPNSTSISSPSCEPVFEPLRQDPELFRQVRVDQELGTVVWPNGADLDPDVLHRDARR